MTYLSEVFNIGDMWGLAGVLALVLLSTLRLTRLVTTDSLGSWFLRDPLERWANLHEEAARKGRARALRELIQQYREKDDQLAQSFLEREAESLRGDDPISPQARLVSGLSCPFCIGFWIGVAVVLLTGLVLWLGIGWLTFGWMTALGALSLNYVTAHISARLD